MVGPTAAGKSALALELAERVGGEIVSADSQQVYRGMDIGTGKVSAAERARVPHHCIDIAEPDEAMTAARFVELADRAIGEVAGRGRAVVVAGGTGLYVRALLLGLFAGPAADHALRAELAAQPLEALRERLAAVDPELAQRIEPNDRKRISRALEVHTLTGIPMSEHQRRHDHRRVAPRYPARLIGLAPERGELYARIDARCAAMFDGGLIDEVAELRARGYGPDLRSQQAIGYAEVHRHLDGELDRADALRLMQRNTRRYARRQLGWYRPEEAVVWYGEPAAVPLDTLTGFLQTAPNTDG